MRTAGYAAWGVAEYFLYDPPSECQSAPLRGLSLAGGAYREMSECALPNGARGYLSDALGLGLWMNELEGRAELRMYDPATGTNLRSRWPSPARMRADRAEAEVARARAAAARQRADAEVARDQAEARVRELEAQLRAKREARAVEPNGVTSSSTDP